MKKILFVALILFSSNLFAQDWDDDGHERKHNKEKYKKDYFSIGLYGGGHTSNSLNVTDGPFNAISFELEYTKSKKWSFFIKGIYEFTPQTVQELFFYTYEPYMPELFNVQNPTAFNFLFNFGARYYVTQGKVSPYFSAGISNEASFIGKYQYSFYQGEGLYSTAYGRNEFNTFISMDIGTGLKFRLSEKFSLDMQYDVYQYLGKNNNHNAGYSGLIGIKYNL